MFTTPQKTAEQIADEQIVAINAHADASLENFKINYQTSFDLVWKNPNSTPQEIFNRLGCQAVQLFLRARAVVSCLKEIDPSYVDPVPPVEYTINDNGTVTVLIKEQTLE